MGKKEEIGTRLRTMRKSRKLTQEDIAKSIGQSASSITMYETGRREPDFETLEALADVFNVPLSSIIFDDKYSADEIRLVSAYRNADDRAREDALRTLLDHPKQDTVSDQTA